MKASSRPGLVVLAVVCAGTLIGCSSASAPAADFSATAGEPLVISLDDLLGKTGGTAALRVADPEHGELSRRGDGALVYTPKDGFTGADSFEVTTTDAVHLYTTDIPVLGEFGGVPVQASGFGSALAAVPGKPNEFFGLTDRGPNVDGPNKNEKIAPVPDFVPKIGRFELVGNRAVLRQSIDLRTAAGVPFNGQVDTAADTGETILDLNGKTLPPTDHGIDPEGLVALPDGTFWVSDEYGPFLVHFAADGTEIERLAPGHGLPKELSLRTPNQGMEGLTVTPDGATLVGLMQSALNTPGLDGSAKDVPMTRIVTVDLKTKALREFALPMENPEATKVADSEITALSSTTFLVDERDGELPPQADKKLWTVDITGATDIGPDAKVPGAHYDPDHGGLLIGDRPVETLVGASSTADGVAALAKAGVTPVARTANFDFGGLIDDLDKDGKFFGHDKIEGITTSDGGRTLYIANDSDFGLLDSKGKKPPFGLAPKTLPNGTQDTGEILFVDTTKLPAQRETHTVQVTVSAKS